MLACQPARLLLTTRQGKSQDILNKPRNRKAKHIDFPENQKIIPKKHTNNQQKYETSI